MVHALIDAGERVVVLDNLTTGFDWAVAPGASLVIGGCGDQSHVAALIAEHRVEAVVHFAASIVVPDSVRDPFDRNNTVNSHALIETAVKRGVRHFIFSSTAAVYGNPARMPVREDDPTVPTSPYGSSKLMTEIMLRDAGAAHGLHYMVLRYFNVAERLRHRLPDAGRHLHPGLHSRIRSHCRALRCPRLSARRRRLDDAQLRLRPRFFRTGSD
jgi:UDP-glucose 4-epimerase